MATKFYVTDKEGTIKSADGTKAYRLLTGKALYDFLHSPQGKERKFTTEEFENGDVVGIEVSDIAYKEFKKEENRSNYLKKIEKDMQIQVMPYDAIDINGEEVSGDEIIADDTAIGIEDMTAEKEQMQALKDALRQLKEDELYIIKGLFFSNPKKTEKMLAAEKGIAQPNIHKKKVAVLKKLKNFLVEQGIF